MILEGETNDPKRTYYHVSLPSKFPLTKPSTSDKYDVDLSHLDFNISKMTTVIVLHNNQIELQIILFFIIFHCIFNCRLLKLMCVLRKDMWVGNPSHCGIQFTKNPTEVVHDEVKNKAFSKDESRMIILRIFRAMCAWRNGFDNCNSLLSRKP